MSVVKCLIPCENCKRSHSCKGHTQRVNRIKQIENFYASNEYMIHFKGTYIPCHTMVLTCPNVIVSK